MPITTDPAMTEAYERNRLGELESKVAHGWAGWSAKIVPVGIVPATGYDEGVFLRAMEGLEQLKSRPPRAWDEAEDEAIRAEFRLTAPEARSKPTERLLVELYRLAVAKVGELQDQIDGVLEGRDGAESWDK